MNSPTRAAGKNRYFDKRRRGLRPNKLKKQKYITHYETSKMMLSKMGYELNNPNEKKSELFFKIIDQKMYEKKNAQRNESHSIDNDP